MAVFFIENYGCQMNVSESDSLRSLLKNNGHQESLKADEADVVILNTCSVRKTAEIRIEGRLGYFRYLNDPENGRKKIRVVMMGCMAQNVGPVMKKKFPDVLKSIWGTYHKEGILNFLNNLHPRDSLDLDNYEFMDARPQKKFPFKSFVPISHGCDNFCSYCIVPHVRGREIHRKSGDIIDNIKKLIDEGVKEVILLGQNVNSYRDGNIHFPELLDLAAKTTSIERLSFMTSHPKDFSKDLVEVIRQNPNILKSIHLPLQSGNDRILKLMNRKYTVREYMEKINMAQSIDGVLLSTDVIVGFPGETEAEFQDSLDLIKKIGFYEAFTYRYNTRPGTAAAALEDQVPDKVKRERLSILIETQQGITNGILSGYTGKIMPVLAESISKKNKNEISGKSHNGISVFFEGPPQLIGTIVPVDITATSGVGLKGRIKSSNRQ